MLEKREYRAVAGVKAADVWPGVRGWWERAGFAVYDVGPTHLTGASYYSKIGLRREVEVRMSEANDSLYVDVAFRARISEEGAIGGAAAAVLFWPVAVVGGAFSWSEYETEANALLAGFWQYLHQATGKPSRTLLVTAPPFGTPYPVTPPPPAPTGRACSKCGAALQPEWRACPFCGQPAA